MSAAELAQFYRGYIACLDAKDWNHLADFVHEDAHHNGRPVGLRGYREMLEGDHRAIPDLRFNIVLIVAEPPSLASRLWFDCTPAGGLFGLPVNGRRVEFAENVFYQLVDGRIQQVWSVIDKAAIAAQL